MYNYGKEIVDLRKNGNHQKIIEICKREIDRNEEEIYARLQMGIAYSDLGKKDEAYAAWREVINLMGGPSSLPPPMVKTMRSHGFHPTPKKSSPLKYILIIMVAIFLIYMFI